MGLIGQAVTWALSALALVISGLASYQAVRWRPRAHVVIEVNDVQRDQYAEGSALWTIRVANRGTAAVLDMKAHLMYEGKEVDSSSLGRIESDAFAEIYLGQVFPYHEDASFPAATFTLGPADLAIVRLMVSWRQPPRVEKPRRLPVAFPAGS